MSSHSRPPSPPISPPPPSYHTIAQEDSSLLEAGTSIARANQDRWTVSSAVTLPSYRSSTPRPVPGLAAPWQTPSQQEASFPRESTIWPPANVVPASATWPPLNASQEQATWPPPNATHSGGPSTYTSPIPEPVVLQWTPPQPARPSPAQEGPITYSFSQLGFNTMLLLPPPEHLDSRPLYHITVEMNCLRPASLITVLRRGSSERGPYVGEFECHSIHREWINSRYDRVNIGTTSKLLQEPVIKWVESKDRNFNQGLNTNTMHWRFGQVALQWHHVGGWRPEKIIVPQCTMFAPGMPQERGLLLATLHYADPAKARQGERPVTKITLTKKGREDTLVDHILITALILQRDLWWD